MSDVYEKGLAREITYQRGTGTKQTMTIMVLDAASQDAAATVASAYLLDKITVDGVQLVKSTVTPRALSDRHYEVSVDYIEEDKQKAQERPEPGTWHFSFSGQNGQATIKQSLANISRQESSAGDPAPDLKGIIDWDGEKIKGVEIIVPSFEFDITAYYNPVDVDMAQCLAWAEKRGRTNNGTWFGRAAGEWLYLGPNGGGDIATVSGQRVKPIGVTHKFSFSPNLAAVTIGDIPAFAKKGHEYLWVRYKRLDDAAAVAVLPRPVHAYVERVYESMNFTTFFGFAGA